MKYDLKKYTGRCQECDTKLPSYSWLRCAKCDMIKKARKKPIKVITFKRYFDVLKIFTVCHNLRDIPLEDKRVLVYDDNFEIIGYK